MLYIILMCTSQFRFFFLLMTYYLLLILYLFQTIQMMLDKKQTQVIFLFKFKMGHKAVETTHNINNDFGPGTANECTVQWWFKFCKGDESLEDEERSSWPSEADKDQPRGSSKLIFQLQEKLLKNSALLTMVIQHLEQGGKVKNWEVATS